MGLVTSVTQLLVLRVLQGVIAGFSVFAMALASVSCPKDKVPVAIGRVQGAQLLSVAIGPAAGGYVASHFGLRYAFFVTAGMCALALALSLSGAFVLDGALAWLAAGLLLICARRLRRGAAH
jgi:MFS transporter, DHA1 family, multidrug resistance protein